MENNENKEVEITYIDDNYNETTKEKAKYAMIREYKNGILVQETFGFVNGG